MERVAAEAVGAGRPGDGGQGADGARRGGALPRRRPAAGEGARRRAPSTCSDEPLQFRALMVSSMIARWQGEFDEQQLYVRKALDLAQEIGRIDFEAPGDARARRRRAGLRELRRGEPAGRARARAGRGERQHRRARLRAGRVGTHPHAARRPRRGRGLPRARPRACSPRPARRCRSAAPSCGWPSSRRSRASSGRPRSSCASRSGR